MMDRKPGRGSNPLQKKIIRRPIKAEHVPDLTDFMNDMFFGTVESQKKVYNLNGTRFGPDDDEEEDESFDSSTRSNSSRLTQEWLEEAKKMMSSSPTRCDSPSRLVGSPKFAAVASKALAAPVLEKRDPLSRSARRHRAVEGFSGEILIKSTKHTRNKSETLDNIPTSPSEPSPTSQVQQWLNSNILKPSNTEPNEPSSPSSPSALPPRQSTFRKSRFQTTPTSPALQIPTTQSFKSNQIDKDVLSPPKNLIESAHRRSISSSTCYSQPELTLSPPRNLVESAHRRSISRSTCAVNKIASKQANGRPKEVDVEVKKGGSLNGFLKEQRVKIDKILNGEIGSKAKVILSGPSNSTSSMIAAICYAWLLENKLGKEEDYVVVPVMNLRRSKMWKQRQAAWLFHYVGLDANSLLFADEVDLESLIMEGKLSIVVVGQDILKTDNEVGSQCAILTDNYCEDAYHLLQTSSLKKLLLSGILLDTQNLNASTKMAMTRDSEAVQLLSVGSPSNYQNDLYRQLMQDQKDHSFFEALRYSYGKPPSEGGVDSVAHMEQKAGERKSTSGSVNDQTITQSSDSKKPKDAKSGRTPKTAGPAAAAAPEASRGKSKFFLAKWFGFGK